MEEFSVPLFIVSVIILIVGSGMIWWMDHKDHKAEKEREPSE